MDSIKTFAVTGFPDPVFDGPWVADDEISELQGQQCYVNAYGAYMCIAVSKRVEEAEGERPTEGEQAEGAEGKTKGRRGERRGERRGAKEGGVKKATGRKGRRQRGAAGAGGRRTVDSDAPRCCIYDHYDPDESLPQGETDRGFRGLT
jgi:hypothetical protein